jgi:hypothetical protein
MRRRQRLCIRGLPSRWDTHQPFHQDTLPAGVLDLGLEECGLLREECSQQRLQVDSRFAHAINNDGGGTSSRR